MEGAVRLFAGEFSRSTLTVPGEDDTSAAWVLTPSGASCRQVFLAGALLEVQERGDILSARLADPTGGFDLVCGGNTPALAASINKIPLPSFISVSGRAQLYRREGSVVPSIRPDQVRVIDRRVRDQWIITTAHHTLERLELMNRALQGTCTDRRILQACSHYSVTKKVLGELAALVAGALVRVGPPEEAERALLSDPRDMIMEFIRATSGPSGVAIEEILAMAQQKAVPREGVLAALESLIVEDECYQPRKGFVKPL